MPNYLFVAANCLSILLHLGIYGLATNGRPTIAKSLYLSLNCLVVFVFLVLMGPESKLQSAFLPLLVTPLLLFDMRKWTLILFHVAQPFIYYYSSSNFLIVGKFRFAANSSINATIGPIVLIASIISLMLLIAAFGFFTTLAAKQEIELNKRLALENRWVKLIQDIAILANSDRNFGSVLEKSLILLINSSQFKAGYFEKVSLVDNKVTLKKGKWVNKGFARMEELKAAWKEIDILEDENFSASICEGKTLWNCIEEINKGQYTQLLGSKITKVYLLPIKINDEVVAILQLFSDVNDIGHRKLALDLGPIMSTQIGRVEERNRAQSKLDESHKTMIRSARLAALGEMAGGIAHEINNPLAIIQAQISKIDKASGNDGFENTVKKSSKTIMATVERIAKIVSGLKSVVRESTDEPYETIKVKLLIQDALELASHRFRDLNIDLRTDPIDDNLQINCRANQILQILLNLLNNAFDAVHDRPHRWVYVEVDTVDDILSIAINDSGEGVAAENLEKLMEPFFTTKPPGQGTGLGLPISKSIAESHIGNLFLDDQAINTRFVLTLPFDLPDKPQRKINISELEISPELIKHL